jgi:hypothetical protein
MKYILVGTLEVGTFDDCFDEDGNLFADVSDKHPLKYVRATQQQKARPMSKPSEKAMRLAEEHLADVTGAVSLSEALSLAADIDAHTAEAMEAQHQATWDRAMEAAANTAARYRREVNLKIRALPCPPLETKESTTDGR